MVKDRETICYVDDNLSNLALLKEVFSDQYNVVTFSSPLEAIDHITTIRYKVFIVDYIMPEMNGLEFISEARKHNPYAIYMILTAYPDLDVTVTAINRGDIFRFIYKPWKIPDLSHAIENAFESFHLKEDNRILVQELKQKNEQLEVFKLQLEEENQYLQEEIKTNANFDNIISQNKDFQKVLKQVEQVAETNASVLIQGETGTGKELIARAIHSISRRNGKAFIKVNCAAIPETLIESELFGHKKGAFTGAVADKKGKFELAHNGTIFLDEVGELPLHLQPKLLRVLQEGEVEKVGDPSTMQVDVRVIAATNRNLNNEIEAGNFRDDLFYRLNVFPIIIPPLRDRKDDIPPLVSYLIEKHNRNLGKNIETVSKKTMTQLLNYQWPGNVRELENFIERSMIISSGKSLELSTGLSSMDPIIEKNSNRSLEEVEREHIISVLESTNWRVSGERGAAKILGMKPTTLESRLHKLGISKP